MGLLDVLNGMQSGPHGQREPSTTAGGGMSKMTMALIALLGYQVLKSFTGTQPTRGPGNPGLNPGKPTGTDAQSGGIMGGLGDLLKGLWAGCWQAQRREAP